jgi:hypothetical protein
MFAVSEEDTAAIRAAFEQGGEFAAAVELRRRFSGIADNAQARMHARTIAGWKPLALPPRPPVRLSRRSRSEERDAFATTGDAGNPLQDPCPPGQSVPEQSLLHKPLQHPNERRLPFGTSHRPWLPSPQPRDAASPGLVVSVQKWRLSASPARHFLATRRHASRSYENITAR